MVCVVNGTGAEAWKMKTCALRALIVSRIHLFLKKEKESEYIHCSLSIAFPMPTHISVPAEGPEAFVVFDKSLSG